MSARIQRDPATGAVMRRTTDGITLNSVDPATGDLQRLCCPTSPTCPCLKPGGGTGNLNDSLTVHISGVTIPTQCLKIAIEDVGGAAFQFVSVPINGTFCFDRVANGCDYKTTLAVQIIAHVSQSLVNGGVQCPCDCNTAYDEGFCFAYTFNNLNLSITINEDYATGKIYPQLTVDLDFASITPTPTFSVSLLLNLFTALLGVSPLFWNILNFATTPELQCTSSSTVSNVAAFYYNWLGTEWYECRDATNSWPSNWCQNPQTSLWMAGLCCGGGFPFTSAPQSHCPPPNGKQYGGTAQINDIAC